MSTSLIDKIQQSVLANPSAPAFIVGGKVVTYRQLWLLVGATANQLHTRGIKPGDAIGLSLNQTALHCVVMLALAKLGAIAVSMHPAIPVPARKKIAEKFGVKMVISHEDSFRIESIAFMRLDTLSSTGAEDLPDTTDFTPNAATPMRILLSSGTTGEPKGILFTHSDMLDRMEKTLFQYSHKTRLIPFDIHFSWGFVAVLATLAHGGSVVFPPSYRPADLTNTINLHAVTGVTLSPAMAATLMPALLEPGIAFPTLEYMCLGGGPCPPKLLEQLRSSATPNIYISYGSSELAGISLATPDMLLKWPTTCGRIQPWITAETVNKKGNPLPAGESGEIRLRMKSMPERYHMDKKASAKSFRDGWFYTGDFGRISDEGLLFLEGRSDDTFNIGGQVIDPHHIEQVLSQHPGVREAVAFLMPTESGLGMLAAAVIPHATADLKGLLDYCKRQLARSAPERIFIMQDFPRNPSGKVLRKAIPAAATQSIKSK